MDDIVSISLYIIHKWKHKMSLLHVCFLNGYSMQLLSWSSLACTKGVSPHDQELLSCELAVLNSRGLLSILNISFIFELKQVAAVISGPFPLLFRCFFFFFCHAAHFFLWTAWIQKKPFHKKSHLSEMRNESRHVLAVVQVLKVCRHYCTIQLQSQVTWMFCVL